LRARVPAALAALVLALAFAAAPRPAHAVSCGHWRWPVKTGSDADRQRVRWAPQDTSVRYLATRPPPATFGAYAQDHRIGWPERRTWELPNPTLVRLKLEDDGDVHLILAGKSGTTMIAEIPDPACVPGWSRWKTQIAAARAALAAQYRLTGTWAPVGREMDIRGLGFFDSLHGQAGAAANGIELHPVTRVRFLS
jgi:hypothetical protein